MSNKEYYKFGSVVLVCSSFAFAFLIIYPFIDIDSEDTTSSLPKLMLEDELRLHRDLYLQVSNSDNPVLAEDLKDKCKSGLKDIETTLYSQSELTQLEEYKLRSKLHSINLILTQNTGFIDNNSQIEESAL